ncbi:LOW QUALITY PROTEIN: hypothetical protein CVT26_002278 [Gymnopilus dilepis]|uniref:Uncharacterized protein n=1 Tax=Gymnopilus dilepis TaxID=231916 RepID=A0A409YN00_9AGAR|nr:LOW QUALITY PROTEIN: hypothetical protein CVT26_002278 [Gymnopilus dilepis]
MLRRKEERAIWSERLLIVLDFGPDPSLDFFLCLRLLEPPEALPEDELDHSQDNPRLSRPILKLRTKDFKGEREVKRRERIPKLAKELGQEDGKGWDENHNDKRRCLLEPSTFEDVLKVHVPCDVGDDDDKRSFTVLRIELAVSLDDDKGLDVVYVS